MALDLALFDFGAPWCNSKFKSKGARTATVDKQQFQFAAALAAGDAPAALAALPKAQGVAR